MAEDQSTVRDGKKNIIEVRLTIRFETHAQAVETPSITVEITIAIPSTRLSTDRLRARFDQAGMRSAAVETATMRYEGGREDGRSEDGRREGGGGWATNLQPLAVHDVVLRESGGGRRR
jgi:hypothetical protein